jgi:high affinity sulfate transporter 1
VRTYRREWLASDVIAGVSVAAAALPIGMAYARLAGFPPVVGIYSSILPPVAYAIFGSSRQLIVNPDAAVCAMVAATLAPLAAGDAARYAELSIALTLLTGVLCIAGGLAGFGVIANFLSRPILTGYLNGIALSIIAGQLATLFGFHVGSGGFFRTVARVAQHLGDTHAATVALGLALFVVLRALKHLAPRAPAAFVAVSLGIGAVYTLGLDRHGVALVGDVPPGFLAPHLPSVDAAQLWPLALGACGLVLVSFCSMMTTARGFAAKNGYAIDTNRDMIALGACDIASGLSRGFVVSGADSRTAVADSAGGKTQVTGLVAAAAMTVVLLWLTRPLAYLPSTALAAILISSALGLFDVGSLRRYYHVSPAELRHSIVATLGVMTVGVLPGVLIAVGLALLRLLRLASHPRDAILGVVDGKDGVYGAEGDGARTIPGLVIYRFDASVVFFNADYFKERVLAVVNGAETPPRWVLFDAESTSTLDVTGAAALEALRGELSARGIVLAIARAKGRFQTMVERTGIAERLGRAHLFPTVHAGVQAFQAAGRNLAPLPASLERSAEKTAVP